VIGYNYDLTYVGCGNLEIRILFSLKSMSIRLVIFDADQSLWSGRVGFMDLPFERIDRDTISSAYGNTITLFPKTRRLLRSLKDAGVTIGMASWNEDYKVEEALRLLELLEFFPRSLRKVWWERGKMKHLMIAEIIEEVKRDRLDLKYSEILFYDDDPRYFPQVHETLSPEIHCLQAGVDLKIPHEILDYIEKAI